MPQPVCKDVDKTFVASDPNVATEDRDSMTRSRHMKNNLHLRCPLFEFNASGPIAIIAAVVLIVLIVHAWF